MGKHLLLEVYDVDFALLNDAISLQAAMESGIKRAKMTILNIFAHCFVPQGCTVVIALSESHVSCHTWPENGCLAIDVYTCGEGTQHRRHWRPGTSRFNPECASGFFKLSLSIALISCNATEGRCFSEVVLKHRYKEIQWLSQRQ